MVDFRRICETEGYRLEDLSKEDQRIVNALNSLADAFEGFEPDFYEGGTLGEIKDEIAEEVIEQVKEWFEATIAEMQVSLAEAE